MFNQSLIAMKFTVAATLGFQLTSMLLTPMVTVESPVALVTRDGEPLGGNASASDDFTTIDDNNEDDFLA